MGQSSVPDAKSVHNNFFSSLHEEVGPAKDGVFNFSQFGVLLEPVCLSFDFSKFFYLVFYFCESSDI